MLLWCNLTKSRRFENQKRRRGKPFKVRHGHFIAVFPSKGEPYIEKENPKRKPTKYNLVGFPFKDQSIRGRFPSLNLFYLNSLSFPQLKRIYIFEPCFLCQG